MVFFSQIFPLNPRIFSPFNFQKNDAFTVTPNDSPRFTTLTTITASIQHTSLSPTMMTSKLIELTSNGVSYTTKNQHDHETSNNFIIIMLVIGLFVLCCIVAFCITATYIINKNKKKRQNNHHEQSKVDIFGVYKVNNINNLEKIQSSNIIKLNVSRSLNGDNTQISSVQSTTIAMVETSGDDNTNLKIKHDHDSIRLWLENISFPDYFSNFVLSGYESIDFVKEIQNESELQEIGISSKSECNHILAEIEKLKMVSIQEKKDDIDKIEIVENDTKTTGANECMQNEGERGHEEIDNVASSEGLSRKSYFKTQM